MPKPAPSSLTAKFESRLTTALLLVAFTASLALLATVAAERFAATQHAIPSPNPSTPQPNAPDDNTALVFTHDLAPRSSS